MFPMKETLVRCPLQESQHGSQMGKSTKTALRSLVLKIERSMQEKQYAVMVLMNNQGEFDSPKFAVIRKPWTDAMRVKQW